MDDMLKSTEGQTELQSYIENKASMESQAGCTGNVVLITENEIICANAGDSRSILRTGQETKALSEDHKPENPKEYARITAAGGYVMDGRVNGNLNLSRAIGDLEYKESKLSPEKMIITAFPDIKKYTINVKDQFILIGCDGVWEKMNNEGVSEFINERISKKLDIQNILTEFLDDNLAVDSVHGQGCDNMSAILV